MRKLMNKLILLLRDYPLTVSISSLIAGLFVFFGAVPESLYFNQSAINQGDLWRLLTAHLVHSDTEHLIWNLLVFIILALLIEQHSQILLLVTLISGSIVIDGYLWINSIGVINYAGLSGVLNTLLVVALFLQWHKYQHLRKLTGLIFLVSLVKMLFELWSHHAIFTHSSWQSLPEAHLAGFLAGIILIVIYRMGVKVLASRVITIKVINRPNLHHSSG